MYFQWIWMVLVAALASATEVRERAPDFFLPEAITVIRYSFGEDVCLEHVHKCSESEIRQAHDRKETVRRLVLDLANKEYEACRDSGCVMLSDVFVNGFEYKYYILGAMNIPAYSNSSTNQYSFTNGTVLPIPEQIPRLELGIYDLAYTPLFVTQLIPGPFDEQQWCHRHNTKPGMMGDYIHLPWNRRVRSYDYLKEHMSTNPMSIKHLSQDLFWQRHSWERARLKVYFQRLDCIRHVVQKVYGVYCPELVSHDDRIIYVGYGRIPLNEELFLLVMLDNKPEKLLSPLGPISLTGGGYGYSSYVQFEKRVQRAFQELDLQLGLVIVDTQLTLDGWFCDSNQKYTKHAHNHFRYETFQIKRCDNLRFHGRRYQKQSQYNTYVLDRQYDSFR